MKIKLNNYCNKILNNFLTKICILNIKIIYKFKIINKISIMD